MLLDAIRRGLAIEHQLVAIGEALNCSVLKPSTYQIHLVARMALHDMRVEAGCPPKPKLVLRSKFYIFLCHVQTSVEPICMF